MRPVKALFRLEKRVQIHAGKHPALFYGLYALSRGNRRRAVGKETDLVIEGFPRSANSFAVVAFRHAQRKGGKKVRLANNLHVPAQVVRAAGWRIPALVLIRNPKDAVASYRIRDGIPLALEYYVSFYEALEPYRDDFILGRFEEVTGDFGAVIKQINTRFGTDFLPFHHTTHNVRRTFARIDESYERSFEGGSTIEEAVSRPSAAREETKRRVREELESWKTPATEDSYLAPGRFTSVSRAYLSEPGEGAPREPGEN